MLVRTRRGIRTPNIPALNRTPLPSWTTRARGGSAAPADGRLGFPAGARSRWRLTSRCVSEPAVTSWSPAPAPEGFGASTWRRSDSNRLPPLCKSGALPGELHPHGASGRARTDYLALTKGAQVPTCFAGMEPVTGLEPATSAIQGRRATCCASPACVPSAGFEPAPSTSSTSCLFQLDHEGMLLGAEDSNLHELLQRQPCCRVTSAPNGGRRAAVPPTILSARRERPTTVPAG